MKKVSNIKNDQKAEQKKLNRQWDEQKDDEDCVDLETFNDESPALD